jgi:hypothetical protein
MGPMAYDASSVARIEVLVGAVHVQSGVEPLTPFGDLIGLAHQARVVAATDLVDEALGSIAVRGVRAPGSA